MTKYHLALDQRHSVDGERIIFETLDIPTALAIADINVGTGSAELWQGRRKLGRLNKHGGDHATFWEIVAD